MKVIIGKSKVCYDKFLKSFNIDKKEINDMKTIAEKFKSYFINVRSNVATKIS